MSGFPEDDLRYGKGYRVGDVQIADKLKPIDDYKESLEFTKVSQKPKYQPEFRPVVCGELPWSYDGHVAPRPDHTDVNSKQTGVRYRVGRGHPYTKSGVKNFGRFVKSHLEEIMNVDGDYNYLPDLEEWLGETNYNEERKQQIRDTFAKGECHDFGDDFFSEWEVHSFSKDESYKNFKHLREIMARSDYIKGRLGPFFWWIQKMWAKYTSADYDIKGLCRQAVAEKINSKLGDKGPYYVTDWTSMESSMVPDMMDACEFQVYKAFGKYIPNFFNTIWQDLLQLKQVNEIKCDMISYKILGCRMSGEMNTSFSNGIVNYFTVKYAAYLSGVHCVVMCEGDDGIAIASGELDFSVLNGRLPVFLKTGKVNIFENSDFVSLVVSRDGEIVCDPAWVMVKIGWTGRQYARSGYRSKLALLRMKAMSYLYNTPGCPVVANMCERILELTKDVTSEELQRVSENENEGKWFRQTNPDWVNGKRADKPSDEARWLFTIRYGVTAQEQIELEETMSTMPLGRFSHPTMDAIMDPDWKTYNDIYVSNEKEALDPHLLGTWSPDLDLDYYTLGKPIPGQ